MSISDVIQNEHGSWMLSVYPVWGHDLLAALDEAWPFVLVETWDAQADWHEVTVSVVPEQTPRPRLVRRHSFDLLCTPREAAEDARARLTSRDASTELLCYQFSRRPKATFHVPDLDRPRARNDAMRGQGVEICIYMPHQGEPAVVWSPRESALSAYARRLGDIQQTR